MGSKFGRRSVSGVAFRTDSPRGGLSCCYLSCLFWQVFRLFSFIIAADNLRRTDSNHQTLESKTANSSKFWQLRFGNHCVSNCLEIRWYVADCMQETGSNGIYTRNGSDITVWVAFAFQTNCCCCKEEKHHFKTTVAESEVSAENSR